MTRLKVTLKRSAVKRPKDQQETVMGLGLRHIGQNRVLENTPAVRGMVKKIIHLVDVEEVTVEVAPPPPPEPPPEAPAKKTRAKKPKADQPSEPA